jgi:DNA-binding XRE family transcriptional regulator
MSERTKILTRPVFFWINLRTNKWVAEPPIQEQMGMMNKKESWSAVNIPYGKVATAAEIGRLIRHKRREVGALQESAAGLAGVGTKFLSQLENGKETAELGKVLRVLKAMGLEVYIFPRASSPFKDR